MTDTAQPAGDREDGVEIVDLDPGDGRLPQAWAVMAELRPHREPEAMDRVYADSHPLGYRVTALFHDGQAVAVAGWRLGVNLHLGRNLYVEDLVTADSARSRGFGARLLGHLRAVARAEGCSALHLDSGVQRHGAHRFYLREGMHISSHHFTEEL